MLAIVNLLCDVNQHILSLISIHLYWSYKRYCRVTMIHDFHRNMNTGVHLFWDRVNILGGDMPVSTILP